MMTNKTNYFDWNNFIQSWQFLFAALSAVIYILGYINAVLFLHSSINFQAAPTEIYSVSSLFVWGLTFFISSLVMPIIVYSLTLLLKKYGAFSNQKRTLFVVIMFPLLCFFFLPFIARNSPFGFQIVPDYWYMSTNLFIRVLTTIALFIIACLSFLLANKQINFNRLVLVFFILVVWNIVLLRGVMQNAIWIGIGAPPGFFAQDPAIQGALITRSRVSGSGSEAPEFGAEAFVTYGLLLSRKDGAYYFSPGSGHAQEHLEGVYEGPIIIVPEGQVITFIADKGAVSR